MDVILCFYGILSWYFIYVPIFNSVYASKVSNKINEISHSAHYSINLHSTQPESTSYTTISPFHSYHKPTANSIINDILLTKSTSLDNAHYASTINIDSNTATPASVKDETESNYPTLSYLELPEGVTTSFKQDDYTTSNTFHSNNIIHKTPIISSFITSSAFQRVESTHVIPFLQASRFSEIAMAPFSSDVVYAVSTSLPRLASTIGMDIDAVQINSTFSKADTESSYHPEIAHSASVRYVNQTETPIRSTSLIDHKELTASEGLINIQPSSTMFNDSQTIISHIQIHIDIQNTSDSNFISNYPTANVQTIADNIYTSILTSSRNAIELPNISIQYSNNYSSRPTIMNLNSSRHTSTATMAMNETLYPIVHAHSNIMTISPSKSSPIPLIYTSMGNSTTTITVEQSTHSAEILPTNSSSNISLPQSTGKSLNSTELLRGNSIFIITPILVNSSQGYTYSKANMNHSAFIMQTESLNTNISNVILSTYSTQHHRDYSTVATFNYSTTTVNYTSSLSQPSETPRINLSNVIFPTYSTNVLRNSSAVTFNHSLSALNSFSNYIDSSSSTNSTLLFSTAMDSNVSIYIVMSLNPSEATSLYNQTVSVSTILYNYTTGMETTLTGIDTTTPVLLQSSFTWLNHTTEIPTILSTQSVSHMSLLPNVSSYITNQSSSNMSITQATLLSSESNNHTVSLNLSAIINSTSFNNMFTSIQHISQSVNFISSSSSLVYNTSAAISPINPNISSSSMPVHVSKLSSMATPKLTTINIDNLTTEMSSTPSVRISEFLSSSIINISPTSSLLPITQVPTSNSPPLAINLLDKSETELEFSISLKYFKFKSIDKVEVIAQRYESPNTDSSDDSSLLPLTWYKVNYYPRYKYRSYVTQVYVFLRTIVDQRNRRQRRGVTHLAAPKDGILYIRIGDENRCEQQSSSDPCNGPLIAGESYRFQLLIHLINTPNPISTGYSSPLQTQLKTDTGGPNVTSTLTSTSIIIITIIVLIILLIIVLIIVGVIVWRRRSRNKSLHTIEMDGKCSLLRKCKKQTSAVERIHHSGYILDEQQVLRPTSKGLARPVSVKDFYHWVTRSSADSDFRFAEEFESIRDIGRDKTHDASDMAENRGKNRYVNVLAYDHTRVKLSYTDDEAGSDYINANYIHGYKQPRAYIATQGPLPGTTDDFWRMVWEQDCHVIVMVTQCVERGRVKCHRYWPSVEPTMYGDISVSLLSEYAYTDWIEREFLLETEGDEPRTVHHLQYSSWPDHGVPKSQTSIIDFVKAVRSYGSPNHEPMIIHCSAGVGRTGTFIAIDMIMWRLCDENTVDIYGAICLMRMQRCSMVQTEDQYIFIHRAIMEYLQSKENDAPIQKSYTMLANNDSQIDFTAVKEEREMDPFITIGESLEEKDPNEKTAFLQSFTNPQSETIA